MLESAAKNKLLEEFIGVGSIRRKKWIVDVLGQDSPSELRVSITFPSQKRRPFPSRHRYCSTRWVSPAVYVLEVTQSMCFWSRLSFSAQFGQSSRVFNLTSWALSLLSYSKTLRAISFPFLCQSYSASVRRSFNAAGIIDLPDLLVFPQPQWCS